MSAQLTARGAKMRLSRAKVDYSTLTITEKTVEVHSRGIDGERVTPRNVVTVEGDGDDWRDACRVLSEAGFWCAPYPGRREYHA